MLCVVLKYIFDLFKCSILENTNSTTRSAFSLSPISALVVRESFIDTNVAMPAKFCCGQETVVTDPTQLCSMFSIINVKKYKI